MLVWIEIILAVIACFSIGAIYAITGYEVTNLFTDGPNWRPWEQMLFWLIWPIIIPFGLCLVFAIFIVAIVVSIFIAFVIIFDLIKSAIKKLSR